MPPGWGGEECARDVTGSWIEGSRCRQGIRKPTNPCFGSRSAMRAMAGLWGYPTTAGRPRNRAYHRQWQLHEMSRSCPRSSASGRPGPSLSAGRAPGSVRGGAERAIYSRDGCDQATALALSFRGGGQRKNAKA
jgi:hypothetical protein